MIKAGFSTPKWNNSQWDQNSKTYEGKFLKSSKNVNLESIFKNFVISKKLVDEVNSKGEIINFSVKVHKIEK